MKRIADRNWKIVMAVFTLTGFAQAQSLVKIGQCKTGTSITEAVFLKGNYAYVSAGSELAIVNISNPASPWVEGSIGNPPFPMSCFVIDTIAYVYQGGSLWCVSVANPTSPYWFSNIGLPRGGTMVDGIYVRSNIAYLCVDQSGMYLVDISNPRTPAVSDSFKGGGWPIDLDMRDTLLFTTGYNPNAYYDSLLILNAANPHPIREIGSCSVFPWIIDVVVSGNYAYTANWTSGGSIDTLRGVMNVVDVSNPQNPMVVARIDSLVGAANAVYWDSNYVYVATRNYQAVDSTYIPGGVRVIDVHDPTHPKVVAGYNLWWPHDGFDVKAKFPYVYVAGRDSFFVFQFTPSGVAEKCKLFTSTTGILDLSQNMPNPFQEQTEIGFRVSIQSHINIDLYDVSGREVRKLVDEVKLPGFYQVRWNRSDEQGGRVPSGVYFCQLTSGDRSIVKKMVVVD